MFAVYGKSLQKERTRKYRCCKYKISDETAMRAFKKDTGAYQISPDYSSEKQCLEFIDLAKSYPEVRYLYTAKLDRARNKKGEVIINEKISRPKMKYFRFKDIPNQ
ncbi:hypothetical protein [Snodgrassella alvi]|uniref:hypothetical protein n=1 Tax=Snodgrassella alvi TaxID=1196083 RepID=UPI0009982EBF|nr:hypothetical protein [Snodgrassella alvi]OOX79762.1 hypothetical protein BGH94_03695 [Snodgrassella alvi]ORF02174.1 hypothetical protein BGH95_05820 [Snodgrassella alvi]